MRTSLRCLAFVALCATAALSAGRPLAAQAQPFDKNDRARAKQMLAAIKQSIETSYYDPTYHGIDLNARFKQADQQLDQATTFSMANAVIAQAMLDFGDSHLYFIPPERPSTYEYGWVLRMEGDRCLVLAVKPGSDAERKGLKPGDVILRMETFAPTRANFWKLRYLYYTLSPRDTLKITAQTGDAAPRDIEIAAAVMKKPAVKEYSFEGLEKEVNQEGQEAVTSANRSARAGTVAIWQLSDFEFDPGSVDRVVDTITKDATALVIDLRGDGGGYVDTLQRVAARLFEQPVTLATVKSRKSSKPMTVKPKKPVFTGTLVVIVDADSASAAEVFARAVQLEGRGRVIGDQSAGAVMQAEGFEDALEGLEGAIVYGASITNADLIMKDGKSLERVGVTPDEKILTTPDDLAEHVDRVLARAVGLAGGTLDPSAAGKLFPVEWKK